MLFVCEDKNQHNSCKKRDAMINLLQNPVFIKKSRVLFLAVRQPECSTCASREPPSELAIHPYHPSKK
jgi:hypothetical protein